jgi:hypothetical protein
MTMRAWFSRIESREDALKVINNSAVLFFVLAALQVGVAILLSLTSADVRQYTHIPSDVVVSYVVTAIIIAGLTLLLRSFQSRSAAVCLLLVFPFSSRGLASSAPRLRCSLLPAPQQGCA